MAEVCLDEFCMAEICLAEVCHAEVCPAEVCFSEIKPVEWITNFPLFQGLPSLPDYCQMLLICHL
jgi:hypothetical protein